jgi:hypothetical protein
MEIDLPGTGHDRSFWPVQVRNGSLSPRHVRFMTNNGRWAVHPSHHLAVGL